MKKFFVLLAFVPTVLFAQAPWREFAEHANTPGYGIWGIGNKEHFTRIEGKSNRRGRPGTGKDVYDFWHWEKERFVKHEAYVMGESLTFNMVQKKGPYELQIINDDGSCTWGEGTIKNTYTVVEGVFYDGPNNMLFSGKSHYGSVYYYDGVLIDCANRRQQKWKDDSAVGDWGPLDNTSAALLDKYGPDYGFLSLKEKHPETFAILIEPARKILQNSIENPWGNHFIWNYFPSLIDYFTEYPYMKFALTEQETNDIINSFIRMLRENNISRHLFNICKSAPEIIYNNPRFKSAVFRNLTNDSFLGTGYLSGGLSKLDYYSVYHDYADLTREEIVNLDDSVFGKIAVVSDLEYYMALFPTGRHIDEAKNLYSGGTGEGLYKKQLAFLKNDFIQIARAAINDIVIEGNEPAFDSSGFPVLGTILTARDPNDSKLAYYKVICSNLKEKYSMSQDARDAIRLAENYLHIIDGFWAVENSKDLEACVARDLLRSAITPLTSVTLTTRGKEVKTRFESALMSIDAIEGDEDDDTLLLQTYLYLYSVYADYINSVNGELISRNESVNKSARDNSVFLKYDIEDGYLVITLKNYDRYYYEYIDDYYSYKSGHRVRGSNVKTSHQSLDSAIRASEDMDYEFWDTPVNYR